MGIYYERQENAFQNLDVQELDKEGILSEGKAVQLVKLAQTFLVSDGNTAALSNMRRVFEDDNAYSKVFNENRLCVDSKLIVLCYKIQFRLRKLLKEIEEIEKEDTNKYRFVNRARSLLWALLCQGILNDESIEKIAEKHGKDLSMKVDYTDYLLKITTTSCRLIISTIVTYNIYKDEVADVNYIFLHKMLLIGIC